MRLTILDYSGETEWTMTIQTVSNKRANIDPDTRGQGPTIDPANEVTHEKNRSRISRNLIGQLVTVV